MKTLSVLLLAFVAAATLHAQAPAPVATGKTLLQQLQEIKANNVKLLEQHSATLKRVEELEKNSQSLKMFGRRG